MGPLPPGKVLAANHRIVSALGGDPDLVPTAEATAIRLYHPGLASDQDLLTLRTALARGGASA